MKISPHYIVYALLLIAVGYLAFCMDARLETVGEDPYKKLIRENDSIKKVNAALEDARTIDIQEATKLKAQLDSIRTIRPKNIKRTNNEVSRLHNSTTPGKLSIIDSIIRARKGQH